MDIYVRLFQQHHTLDFAMKYFLIVILFLPSLCFGQIANATIANAKIANAYTPQFTTIPADFFIDFTNGTASAKGTVVTLNIATNGTRSYVKGPWLFQAGNAPQSNTNLVLWTNNASLPFSYFTDGYSYNLSQTTNCWMLTNAVYQFLTYTMPNPGPLLSWSYILRVTESANNIGYNLNGPEVGGEFIWCQWIDDPTTGRWINETAAGGSATSISANGYTNIYLYFTGMANTNLGQTLLFMYTNTAADMSGTWGFVGSVSNHLTLGPGTGSTIFDIGREDVHAVVPASKFEFIMAAVDMTYAHFPMGPTPWTNPWPPTISSPVASAGSTTATVTWTTDQSANSIVNYGTTSAYGSTTSDATMVRSHTINLSGLSTSTTYHYQIVSYNGSGLASSTADATFTTSSGVNNIALVGSQTFHAGSVNASSTTLSTPGNVTSGNYVIVGVNTWSGVSSLTAGMLTKTAGTCTIGTIVMDKTQGNVGGGSTCTAIYRVPITGNGSLTLTFNAGVSTWIVAGGGEFTGFNASPVGTPGQNNATGTSHTTGSITTGFQGMIFYCGTEEPNANFSRTFSDTSIFHVDTGASTSTGIIQYKLFSSDPNTLTDTTGSDSEIWQVIYVPYRSS